MGASGETGREVAGDVRDETVAMPPEALDDPGATVAASPEDLPGAGADPGATRLVDGAATRALGDELPTIVIPEEGTADAPLRDGIDAMDDPYYDTPTIDDLTSASAAVPIPSPVQSLPERRRRMPRWAVALIAVALLAAAAGTALYTYHLELWGGKTVPNVVGMTQDQATGVLEGLGFSVSVEAVLSDEGVGMVLGCDPEPGVRADPSEGAVLSVAAERVVPNVIGLGEEDARVALAEAGAQNVQFAYAGSSEPAGTVIAVAPDVGEPFAAQDQVTVTVARAFTVPNVLGVSLEEALALLEGAGLSGSVIYVDSTSAQGSVVEVNPPVGTEVSEGAEVELGVAASYPDGPCDLLAYFDIAPEALPGFLEQAGFSLEYGEIFASGGNAHAAYVGPGGDLLQISDYPESGRYEGGSRTDVLSRGAGVGGVRYAFSEDALPAGGSSVSEAGIRAIMGACGLDGLLDTCTQDDIVIPEPSSDGSASPRFICGYGRQGDFTWAVIIGGYEGQESAVALAAPTAHFDGVDLAPFGGALCDYIAYSDLYAE